jgi:RNA polymerase sigma factor (sigma-70 family)
MDSLVDLHFADLKKRECSAWNACYGELLTIARRKIDSVAPDLSQPVKTELENDLINQLYKVIDRTESVRALKGWLRRFAYYRTMDECRRLQKLTPLNQGDEGNEEYVRLPRELWNEDNPELFMVSKEENDTLSDQLVMMRQALDQVGSPCKELLIERICEQTKQRVMAERRGLDTGNMSNRINQCLRKVKKLMEKMMAETEMARV